MSMIRFGAAEPPHYLDGTTIPDTVTAAAGVGAVTLEAGATAVPATVAAVAGVGSVTVTTGGGAASGGGSTIVTGGYGLQEGGAIVAGGYGAVTQVEGAIVAHLSGSGSLSADLTDGGTPTVPPAGGAVIVFTPGKKKLISDPVPVNISANLTGSGTLDADGSWFDWNPIYELNNALLVELA